MREGGSLSVENPSLCPVLSAFTAHDAAFQPHGHSTGDGAPVVDLHVAGHGGQAARADGFAHGFIQQSGNDAAMQVAWMTFECGRYRSRADDCAILGKQEVEVKTAGIGGAAAETAVLGRVGQRRQFFVAYRHGFRILNAAATWTRSVVPLLDSR